MATGGQEEIYKEDIAVLTGSEAVFNHICQPCSEETTKEAVGFCVDCGEWLCEECFRTHRRPKPTRHHELKNLAEMKNAPLSVERVDKCTETCDLHNGKKLKYYCPGHDSFGCSKCFIQNHRTCKIQHIPDVSKSVDTMNEFQLVAAKLDTVTIAARDIVSDLNNKEEQVKENRAEMENAFKTYGKKLHETLDNNLYALQEQCEKKEEEEKARLKIISERCVTYEKESLTMKSQLEILEQSEQHCNMFVALKRSNSKLETMKSSIKLAKESSTVNMYTFRPNLNVDSILSGSEGIGTLVKRHGRRDENDYSKLQVQHIADISVKTKANSTCHIIGFVLLPGDKLVLIDIINSQVKVVNTNQNRMISELGIGGQPLGVCQVSDDTVALTIVDKKRIYFMTIDQSGKVSKSKDISVNGKCQGVAVVDDQIIVTYQKPDRIEIMGMNGFVLHAITTNDRGKKIFHTPQYVVPSRDKESVYVSNLTNNTVVCVKLDGTGTVLHEYKDEELKGPEQVAVDSNGMCFVGGYYSKNVHLITPDCKKIKVILGESDGLKDVNAVCFCENSDRLYIGMAGFDIIKVFQLFF